MASSTLVFLLQLLLLSLASASNYFGATMTFTAKGRNPNGTFRVDFRNRGTFDGCQYSHRWYCYSGDCGYPVRVQTGRIDSSTNAPQTNRQWCESETVTTRHVPSDKPFQMREASCCWIPTSNYIGSWKLLTQVDLGIRSDTGEPNRSPKVAILPFLRVPMNCPRSYNLMSFDPDDDQVRCRYGIAGGTECNSCRQPAGFHLDQGSCTLYYSNYNPPNTGVYGFELVVEDFPRRPITLAYTDGSRSSRSPLTVRRGRHSLYGTTVSYPWWWAHTSTPAPSTANNNWWWWQGQHTSTQTPMTTNSEWWWWHQTSTPPSTTTNPEWWCDQVVVVESLHTTTCRVHHSRLVDPTEHNSVPLVVESAHYHSSVVADHHYASHNHNHSNYHHICSLAADEYYHHSQANYNHQADA
uniref:uncharacterized protein n=1 Tax=Centroberyx gerrardi TaxID=166262 RepID=UPI003AAD1490